MMGTYRFLYSKLEKHAATHLSPEVVAHLLPVRFRIAFFYASSGDRTKAQRYINSVCRRKPEIAEMFEHDKNMNASRTLGTPLTAELTDAAIKALLDQETRRLAESTRNLHLLGRVRIAAVFRALLLLRKAMDNIATGRDHGKGHDSILLEIVANDFCQAIMEKPAAIKAPIRERLLEQLGQTSQWDLERKVSVFIDENAPAGRSQDPPLRGKTVMIQGPSNRPSDLEGLAADATAVVGYYGAESLVRSVERVDVSLYPTHKVRKLNNDGRLDIMKDVPLVLLSLREEKNRALCDSVVANYNAQYSNIRLKSCNSTINGGVELFLWVLSADPSCVIITNFDMFTNPSYPSGYIANRPEDRLERDESSWQMKQGEAAIAFVNHDPSQQYSVYKCFHEHDAIRYDSVLDNIISNPLSAHIEELEALYGEDPPTDASAA